VHRWPSDPLHSRTRTRAQTDPLILTHGWPWTFWDFAGVIGPLADPQGHGGDPADAFDVVVPSLPGYGFSTPLTRSGVTPEVIAEIWVRLMCDQLGYARFGAHGADWGMRVMRRLGQAHADRMVGVHLSNASIAGLASDRPWADAFSGIYERSSAPRTDLVAWERARAAHVAVHGIDPQTLAHAMHDSPAGLCAWLVERRRAWSDCDGNVESVFSRDELLTTVTLYWATNSFASSLRLYWEVMNGSVPPPPPTARVSAPTGISLFATIRPLATTGTGSETPTICTSYVSIGVAGISRRSSGQTPWLKICARRSGRFVTDSPTELCVVPCECPPHGRDPYMDPGCSVMGTRCLRGTLWHQKVPVLAGEGFIDGTNRLLVRFYDRAAVENHGLQLCPG